MIDQPTPPSERSTHRALQRGLHVVNGHHAEPARKPAQTTLHPNAMAAAQEARSRIDAACDAAFMEGRRSGIDIGERQGYVAGWRWGFVCGLVWAIVGLAGGLLAAAELGWPMAVLLKAWQP